MDSFENSISVLKKTSTATLTTVLLKRGFRNTFMRGVRPLSNGRTRMVGPAYTMRMIPAREDIDDIGQRESGKPDLQRQTVESIPAGCILVVDSRGDANGASAGYLLATRMQVRGVAGLVTDGGFRDSPEFVKLDMPAFHVSPCAPPVMVRHHPVEVDCAIGCGGVAVYPGDTIVGDDEGVVVIPREITEEVADDCREKNLLEAFIHEELLRGRSVIGLYPPDSNTLEEFRAWCETREFVEGG